MKKLLLILFMMVLIGGLLWYSFVKNKSTPELSDLFDQKPADSTAIVITPSDSDDKAASAIQTGAKPSATENTAQNTQTPEPPQETDNQKPTEVPEQNQEETKNEETKPEEKTISTEENTSEQKTADISENKQPEEKFEHSDNEKQKIIGRYLEAEDFYYTMLYQRYDLDGYDVIKRANNDGYETEYHRVLYYDVNSIADLKKHYLQYFTNDFVAAIDFGAYVEADGKLYCAITDSSSGNSGTKYTYTAESIDITNAYVVRTDTHGKGSTKIKAVNNGGSWYFTSVAIK